LMGKFHITATRTDTKKIRLLNKGVAEMAERVGFEPTVGVNLHTLSKRAP
jgi:hypothetical protein